MAVTGAITEAVSAENPDLSVAITRLERRGQRVRVTLIFMNLGKQIARVAVDNRRTVLRTSDRTHAVTADSAGTRNTESVTAALKSNSTWSHWIEFDLPERLTGVATLTLVGTLPGGGDSRFAPLSFSLPVP
jgi:hypothetical protein